MSKTETNLSERIAELDQAIDWFYGEDFSLDEALPKYEAAAKLAEGIEADLTKLKNKVEVLKDFTK